MLETAGLLAALFVAWPTPRLGSEVKLVFEAVDGDSSAAGAIESTAR